VDAGVLVLERRASPLVPADYVESYRGFVAAGFRRGLRAVLPMHQLHRLGLTRTPPRELDAHAWAKLFSRARSSGAAASRSS
jgi:hypothetical protein